MKTSLRPNGLILSLLVALAAAGTASATTSICREQTVFQSRSGIHAFSGDDTYLYVGLANGKLQRISKSDFTATDLDNAGASITGMTIDANTIFFSTTATENMALHRQIFAISKQGGSPQLIADTTDIIGQMANDNGFVYWIVPSTSTSTADGKIERVAKTGGNVQTVTSGLAIPNALAVDGTSVYFTEEGINQLPPYGLSKVAAGGGNVVHLAANKPGEGIAGIANGSVYFEAREDIHNLGLYSIPTTGGSPTPLHTPLFQPSQVLMLPDGRFIYTVGYFDWTFNNVGGLTVFDGGSVPVVLSTEQISNISVDQSAIYALAGLGNGERIDRFCLNYATAPRVGSVGGSASVLGGTPLTITGHNFQNGAQVIFDNIPGTVHSVTPTTIQVVAPAHPAGIFDVYVINPDGSSGRGQIYFDPLLPAGNPPPLPVRKRALERH